MFHIIKDNEPLVKTNKLIIVLSLVTAALLAIFIGIFLFIRIGENQLKRSANTEGPNIKSSIKDSENYTAEYNSNWNENWIMRNDRIYEYNNNIRTFLILGIGGTHGDEATDSEFEQLTNGKEADGIYLLVVNPDDKTIKLLMINRNSIVDVKMIGIGKNGTDIIKKAPVSIQHGFGGGAEYSCELTRDVVSKLLYDVPIHGYISVDFEAIPQINDSVGGVKVKLEEDMSEINPEWRKDSEILIMGDEALDFVQRRDNDDPDSQEKRFNRQKIYLRKFVSQVLDETKSNPIFLLNLYNNIKNYTVTNLSINQITYAINNYIDYKIDLDKIYMLEGETEYKDDLELFYPDNEKTAEIVFDLFYKPITGN